MALISSSVFGQDHFLNALLVGMKAVGAGDPLHARVLDTYLAEFVGKEHDVFLAALWAVRAQSFVVRHDGNLPQRLFCR
jgi:hypothetical protein